MKCTIPEISWHNRDPVLSVDVQPSKNRNSFPCRLASGGTDTHVVVWYVSIKENGVASIEVAADLQRHQRAVNVVRFSPSGQLLASGDDESVIIIWKQKTDQDIPEIPGGEGETNKEQWVMLKMLRGHLEDVIDLSWSSDSCHLISSSIDNTAMLWDVQKGRSTGLLSGHGGFVQGVAWDPKNQYVATQSSDRTCRIYNVTTKKLVNKISKAVLPVPQDSELHGKSIRLYHDDTLKSYFRRLSFSPDGKLLVTPSGFIEVPNSERHINATYIFTRNDFSRPVVYLPSVVQYTVAVRFCPLLFKLRSDTPLFALPYRMVFAVATKSNVILYDTEQPEPIALISNIHYTRLTDLSWSSDARILLASSTDGYCSIITFCPGELGEEYVPTDTQVESDLQDKCVNSTTRESELPINAGCETKPVTRDSKDSSTSSTENQTDSVSGKCKDGSIASTSSIKSATRIHTSHVPKTGTKPGKRITPITLSKPSKDKASDSTIVVTKSTGTYETVTTISVIEEEVKEMTKLEGSRSQKSSKVEKDKTSVQVQMKGKACHTEQGTPGEKEGLIKDSDRDTYSNKGPELQKNETMEVDKENPQKNVVVLTDVDKSAAEVKPKLKLEEGEKINEAVQNSSPQEELMDVDDEPDKQQNSVKNAGNSRGNSDTIVSKSSENEKDMKEGIEALSPSRAEQLSKVHETTPSKTRPTPTGSLKQTESPCQSSPSDAPVPHVTPLQNRTPRRVQLITLASPKSKKKLL